LFHQLNELLATNYVYNAIQLESISYHMHLFMHDHQSYTSATIFMMGIFGTTDSTR